MRKPLLIASIVAVLLGTATTAGVIMMKWQSIMTPEAEETADGHSKPSIDPKIKAWNFQSEEIETLARDLRAEKAALEQRSKDLDAAAARVATEKMELQRLRTELDGLKDEITKSVPQIEAVEKGNLKGLSKTYASMKPSQAVAILAEMDDASVIKILSMMKTENVAQVLGEMSKTTTPSGPLAPRAAKLSDQLRLLKKDELAQQ